MIGLIALFAMSLVGSACVILGHPWVGLIVYGLVALYVSAIYVRSRRRRRDG